MERIKKLLTSQEPVKWLFYGDSITHGALHTWGQRDYTELFAERVRFELARVMDMVINSAISGNTTRQLLEGFEWRVTQFHPDVVFLMVGMNDCSGGNDLGLEEFESNLNELAERIAALGARLVMQTTCPILPNTSPDREPHFDGFMEAVRRVAVQRELPLIDHTRFWLEQPDRHFFWMSNSFHPNEYGHRAFALLLYRALDIYDPECPSCRFYLP